MSQPQAGLYKAYNRATQTVSKTRQIVMLYDGAIRFLQQAAEAIERKDYEARYHRITRAADIIVGLQSCLDFDAGNNAAKVLFDFYAMMDKRMFALHRSNDLAECQSLIAEMKQMRDVWDKIDRGEQAQAAPGAENSAAPAPEPQDFSA